MGNVDGVTGSAISLCFPRSISCNDSKSLFMYIYEAAIDIHKASVAFSMVKLYQVL